VELLTVLTVLAVLAAIATPSVGRWLEDNRVRAASRLLMSDLETARMMAVTQSTQYEIFFNQALNQYWMERQDPVTLAWSQGAYSTRQLSVTTNMAYEPGVTLSFATGGNKTIVFTPTGTAPGGITAFLASTNHQRNVVVATTGRVTIASIK